MLVGVCAYVRCSLQADLDRCVSGPGGGCLNFYCRAHWEPEAHECASVPIEAKRLSATAHRGTVGVALVPAALQPPREAATKPSKHRGRRRKPHTAQDEDVFSAAWLRRIEERLREFHDLRNLLQEILGKAELALSTARETRADFTRFAAERQPLIERLFHVEGEAGALSEREKEHHEAGTAARRELHERLDRATREFDEEIRSLRQMVVDALSRMGSKR